MQKNFPTNHSLQILILNWRDPKNPYAGGAEISLFEHAKFWAKNGAHITWYSSLYNGEKTKENFEGVTFIRSGSHYTVHLFAYLDYLKGKLGKPQIVIDSFHFIPFFAPLYIRKQKIIGLLNEVAGRLWFMNLFFPFAVVGYVIEQLSLRFIYTKTPFITGSQSAKNELLKIGIISQISVIHHGVTIMPVKTAIIKEKKPTILFLGRITKDKGIKDALLAFSELKKRLSDAKLWIAGKEDYPGILKSCMSGLSTETQHDIVYFGFVSDLKKFELYKKAWVLVHPSAKEGWGLTVIEAASQGTPTVGYNVEGLRDSIQHNKTGILTNTNPGALAEGVEKLISDKKKLSRMSFEAKKWAKEFSWDTSVKKSWQIVLQYAKQKSE